MNIYKLSDIICPTFRIKSSKKLSYDAPSKTEMLHNVIKIHCSNFQVTSKCLSIDPNIQIFDTNKIIIRSSPDFNEKNSFILGHFIIEGTYHGRSYYNGNLGDNKYGPKMQHWSTIKQ